MWGEKTKKLRKELGLTQKECSNITGHSQSSISGYEKSENSDLDYIAKLCNYANIPLWEFFLPNNVNIPHHNGDYETLYSYYKNLPKHLQKIASDYIAGINEAYNHGKESILPNKKKIY